MPTSTGDAERVVACLRSVRVCDGLDAGQLAAITSEIRMRPFVQVRRWRQPVTRSPPFWILVEGELDSFLTDPRGREKWLGTIRQGETVGESRHSGESTDSSPSLYGQDPWHAAGHTSSQLRECIKTYPQMMQNLFLTYQDVFFGCSHHSARQAG